VNRLRSATAAGVLVEPLEEGDPATANRSDPVPRFTGQVDRATRRSEV